jgi:hypothetical protein
MQSPEGGIDLVRWWSDIGFEGQEDLLARHQVGAGFVDELKEEVVCHGGSP